jgi:hypothetical protein
MQAVLIIPFTQKIAHGVAIQAPNQISNVLIETGSGKLTPDLQKTFIERH